MTVKIGMNPKSPKMKADGERSRGGLSPKPVPVLPLGGVVQVFGPNRAEAPGSRAERSRRDHIRASPTAPPEPKVQHTHVSDLHAKIRNTKERSLAREPPSPEPAGTAGPRAHFHA